MAGTTGIDLGLFGANQGGVGANLSGANAAVQGIINTINSATKSTNFPVNTATNNTAFPTGSSTPVAPTGSAGGAGTTSGPTAAQTQSVLDALNADRGIAATNTGANADLLLNGPNGILNTISALRTGQNNVDQQRIQDTLAKTQGLNGVRDMINHGVQSGGVTLANANASNSSASDALARAYGLLGRGEASKVGNQYAVDENKADQAQFSQDQQSEAGIRALNDQKTQAVNQIVATAQQQMAALSSLAGSMGVSGQFDVNTEIANIRANALAALSQYDSQINGATPAKLGAGDIASRANDLATAGTAAAAPYDYTAITPGQLQGTGPVPSELPIFTTPAKKNL